MTRKYVLCVIAWLGFENFLVHKIRFHHNYLNIKWLKRILILFGSGMMLSLQVKKTEDLNFQHLWSIFPKFHFFKKRTLLLR